MKYFSKVTRKVFNFEKKIMNLEQDIWTTQLKNDDNAIIIDVRTEEECNDGIIEGAINIDIYQANEFTDLILQIDKNKSIYVYCRSGVRSSQACMIMNQMGFESTYNLIGGITKWSGEIV